MLILRCTEDTLAYRLVEHGVATIHVAGEIRRIGTEPEHHYSYPNGAGQGGTDALGFDSAVARMAELFEDIIVPPGEHPQVTVTAHLFPTGASTGKAVAPVDEALFARLSADDRMPANRHAALVLRACRERFSKAVSVAVWDDAFFADLPGPARSYLLPEALTARLDLRRRGARGLLHAAAVERVLKHLGDRDPKAAADARLVVVFLERHAGVTAVKGGRPVWTTFGLAPGDGLPGERNVGNVDAGVLEAILVGTDMSPRLLLGALRSAAGLGLSEGGGIERLALEASRGIERSREAFEVFVGAVASAVGGAAVALGGIDGLVFVGDGAVGSHRFREALCERLAVFGVEPPADVPVVPFDVNRLTPDHARPAVYAVPLEEHDLVVREVTRLLKGELPGEDPSSPRPTLS